MAAKGYVRMRGEERGSSRTRARTPIQLPFMAAACRSDQAPVKPAAPAPDPRGVAAVAALPRLL